MGIVIGKVQWKQKRGVDGEKLTTRGELPHYINDSLDETSLDNGAVSLMANEVQEGINDNLPNARSGRANHGVAKDFQSQVVYCREFIIFDIDAVLGFFCF